MSHPDFTFRHRAFGRVTAWCVFALEVIADPFFSIMELLIIPISPLMIISMVAVHAYAPSEARIYSLTALIFISLAGSITTSNHFVS